jgi:hypothetical protein
MTSNDWRVDAMVADYFINMAKTRATSGAGSTDVFLGRDHLCQRPSRRLERVPGILTIAGYFRVQKNFIKSRAPIKASLL